MREELWDVEGILTGKSNRVGLCGLSVLFHVIWSQITASVGGNSIKWQQLRKEIPCFYRIP